MIQALRDILLSWMRPTQSGLDEAIARITSGDATLTHLNLRNTGMTDPDLKKLRRAIRSSHNQTLVTLDVSHNVLSDIGLKEFEDWASLTDLDISANYFSKAGIASICKNPGLKRLSARQNKLDHESASLLSQRTQYEALDLGSNNLKDKGAKALAQCPHLLVLDISDNQITDNGIAEFASHSTLTHLVARINNITDEGLNGCLSQNTTLTYLDMGNNLLICPTSIGDHPGLIYFKGYANHINDDGATAIARNTRLKVALLSANHITSKGAKLLDASGYSFLDLSGNPVIQDHNLQAKVFLSYAKKEQCYKEFPPIVILRERPSSPAARHGRPKAESARRDV